ncbi:hypothetical protein RB195_022889 [Necator americanus]|uniref:Reverse transcriptase domain-containing protein n=1 Tax=Necator americanus TaxID=51031 RepID=A0ABR1EGZ2_NECAM
MGKSICYRQRKRKEVVYGDCVLKAQAFVEGASKPRTKNMDRISKTTKKLLERRRTLKLDQNALHIKRKKRIPDHWKTTSRTVLIHKKGDRDDIRNYRPICFLSVLCKVFNKIIPTRVSRTLDEAQPQEQAGFRHGFSCLDHIQTVSRIIYVCWECRLPFVLTFVDCEKSFDSVETNAMLLALIKVWQALANCYDHCHV